MGIGLKKGYYMSRRGRRTPFFFLTGCREIIYLPGILAGADRSVHKDGRRGS